MPEKIILDIDPGIDDSIALLYALCQKRYQVMAVSVTSGNVCQNQGLKNAHYVLQHFATESTAIPLLRGADFPFLQSNWIEKRIAYTDATDTHGADGLGETGLASGITEVPVAGQAVEEIIKLLRRYPGEINIFALAPLTTLAAVVQCDSEVLQLAKSINIMGGAYRVSGNSSPVAEYNFWCDPYSARDFFAHYRPQRANVYLYTLDATYAILLNPNMREMLRQINSPTARFIYEITRFYVDFHWRQERTLGCIINDPLLLSDVLQERKLVDFVRADISVSTDELTRGESIVHLSDSGCCHVSTGARAAEFFTDLFKTVLADDYSEYFLMKDKNMI